MDLEWSRHHMVSYGIIWYHRKSTQPLSRLYVPGVDTTLRIAQLPGSHGHGRTFVPHQGHSTSFLVGLGCLGVAYITTYITTKLQLQPSARAPWPLNCSTLVCGIQHSVVKLSFSRSHWYIVTTILSGGHGMSRHFQYSITPDDFSLISENMTVFLKLTSENDIAITIN